MFVVYFVSGVAETNRHPFDVVEGESEIVAGHMIEYSGMAFALFFLAEYANMILVSALAAILFLGGWDAPFEFLSFIPGSSGWCSRSSRCCRCSSGCARRSRATATTRSCVWAGRCSSRHADLGGRGRLLDDVAAEHLEVRIGRNHDGNQDFFKTFFLRSCSRGWR
jgi:hypothetical protein